MVFGSGWTTKREGGSKTPRATKKKKTFFYDYKKIYKNHMKHKKKNCMLCSVLVNIAQQKKFIKKI